MPVALMESQKAAKGRTKKVTIAAIGLGLLVVAAVGIGVGVGLSKRKGSSSSVSDASSGTNVDASLENRSLDGDAVSSTPEDGSSVASPPTGTISMGSPPSGTLPTGTPPSGTLPTGTPPTGVPPTAAPPTAAPPTAVLPAAVPPTAAPPAATPPTVSPPTPAPPVPEPPTPSPPTASPPAPTAQTEAEELLEYYSSGDQCPPGGVVFPQWTGRAATVIGVPAPIQDLYAEVTDGMYDPVTKEYKLTFGDLPEDLTYCTQGATVMKDECREQKAVTGSLAECGNTEGTEMWTHNNGLKRCEKFTYNGCGGNSNQFTSQSLCQLACETPVKATMGGTITFGKDDGSCSLPPTKPDGSPCCALRLWQPNYAGFYFDNCSVTLAVGGDGKFFFKTEIPGSEFSAQWGPDPFPHIHYDILCKDCETYEHFTTKKGVQEYRYWNKFYPEDICDWISCYGGETMKVLKPGPEHAAQKKEVVDGELRYTYDMTLPAAQLDFKYGRP